MGTEYLCSETDLHYQPHTHSEYTIQVCLAGEITVQPPGPPQALIPGETLIVNPGTEHASGYRAGNGRSCEAVSLSLDRRLLATLTEGFDLPFRKDTTQPAFLGKVQDAGLLEIAQEIAQELKRQRPGHKVIIETQSLRLLIETLRRWPRSGIVGVAADLANRLPRREFIRAYEFMRRCRKEDFRLPHLCRFLGSSEERFTRLFLATTRHPPASFYNRLLLDRARKLLCNPKLSIKAIGFELGYKTSSHFIAAFRREYAVAPQEYRQNFILFPRQPKPLVPEIIYPRPAIRPSTEASFPDWQEGKVPATATCDGPAVAVGADTGSPT